MSESPKNTFLEGPLVVTYAKTALPIIFVMAMSGLLAVADALFLGHYVGPDALAAVTLMFPVYMLIVALATLVSNGMSPRRQSPDRGARCLCRRTWLGPGGRGHTDPAVPAIRSQGCHVGCRRV